MTLDDIATGVRVAVDANILIYHFTGQSRACQRFLRRCQSGELRACMPAHTALEVLHRRMTIEAVETGVASAGNVARKLAQHPDRVRQLLQCHADFAALRGLGIDIIATTPAALNRIHVHCLTYGLLANDAALVAVMEEEGISHLATADNALARMSVITVYQPDDL